MAEAYESLGEILVIIPTYNELENIGPITARIRAAVPTAHILIADDNSPDGTGDRADQLAAADDHIHVNHRKGKEGLAKAYLDSFQWGLDQGYKIFVEHDADGSHRPEDLPRLLNALVNADMVKGSRWVKGGKVENYPKSREMLSRGGSLWIKLWLGLPVKDPTGGMNAFRDYVLKAIMPKITATGYLFQTELTFHATQAGFTVAEVPITFPQREWGSSKLSGNIFTESLLKVTQWGARHRGGQLKEVGIDAIRGGHALYRKMTGKKSDLSKCPYHRAQEQLKKQREEQ